MRKSGTQVQEPHSDSSVKAPALRSSGFTSFCCTYWARSSTIHLASFSSCESTQTCPVPHIKTEPVLFIKQGSFHSAVGKVTLRASCQNLSMTDFSQEWLFKKLTKRAWFLELNGSWRCNSHLFLLKLFFFRTINLFSCFRELTGGN